jgi:hypothetical protein
MTRNLYQSDTRIQSAPAVLQIPDTRPMSLADAAAEWARGEWTPMPASRDKAVPRFPWPKMEGLSPSAVHRVFEQYPNSRLCINLPASVVVLDIDHRPEEKGWRADRILAELQERYDLPTGPRCHTPKGGMHLWYTLPSGVRAKNWTSAHKRFPVDGVDIRSLRGLATVPPTVRSDGEYRWERQISAIPLAPDSLCKDLQPAPTPTTKKTSLLTMSRNQASAYIAKVYRSEVEAVRSSGKGGRNDQLFRSAASLGAYVAGGAISTHEVKQALLNAAKECGLVRDDGAPATLATIESGLKAGAQNPRRVPRSMK